MKTYRYVGPPDIRTRSARQPPGRVIHSPSHVLAWIEDSTKSIHSDELFPATFVINLPGQLLLADRHSEHVACAAGHDVLAAGEIFFTLHGRTPVVTEISNQSTGYCPDPSCWPAVEAALNAIGLDHPGHFTTECTFRRCNHCRARNVVKDAWFHCDICGQPLPATWNFDPPDEFETPPTPGPLIT